MICLVAQAGLCWSDLETKNELKVIAVLHLAGLGPELFKTQGHCWAYPEPAWIKFWGIPLCSGFMYASIASHLCQAWQRLDVHLHHWPRAWLTRALAGAIYLNFFSKRWLPDARWVLTVLVLLVFHRATSDFAVRGIQYALPLPIAFALIGFFLWVAENIATFFGAWQHPNQHGLWHPVALAKMSSWSLLVILSFPTVAQLKRVKGTRAGHPGARSSSSG